MSKLLLTAFEPYNGRKKNISLDILENVNKKVVTPSESLVLPVVFDDSKLELDHIKYSNPDYIFCLGECSRPSSGLEKRAKNLIRCEGGPDNMGRMIEKEKILKAGPAFYLTTFPYGEIRSIVNREIIKHLRKKDCELVESEDAGSFVCNFLFYKLLHEFHGSRTKVGFMHIPYSGDVHKLTDITHLIVDYIKNGHLGGKENE